MPSDQFPTQSQTPVNISVYSSWPEIFRSWGWRYYDFFFRLVLYNFLWIVSCLAIEQMAARIGFFDFSKPANYFSSYLIYLLICAMSVGWAYLVFKTFMVGQCKISDVWLGLKKYFIKFMALSMITGFVIEWTVFNARYYIYFNNSHGILNYLLLGFTLWILLFWVSAALYQWPILFFRDQSLIKIVYKSIILVMGNGFLSFGTLLFFTVIVGLFSLLWPLWFFFGFVFFFSFQCVMLEKQFLRYKIIYEDKPLDEYLEGLERERSRGWREFWKPWENR